MVPMMSSDAATPSAARPASLIPVAASWSGAVYGTADVSAVGSTGSGESVDVTLGTGELLGLDVGAGDEVADGCVAEGEGDGVTDGVGVGLGEGLDGVGVAETETLGSGDALGSVGSGDTVGEGDVVGEAELVTEGSGSGVGSGVHVGSSVGSTGHAPSVSPG